MSAAASSKPKFARSQALAIAEAICAALAPHCVGGRCVVAGSLRRGKELVGDAEIVAQPVPGALIADLLGNPDGREESAARRIIDGWIAEGRMVKRPNKLGGTACGEKNLLLVHAASRVPVDIFLETTCFETAWWSLLVCRTGGAETNVALAQGAHRHLRQWNPYRGVFDQKGRAFLNATSEQCIFDQCGVPFAAPTERR